MKPDSAPISDDEWFLRRVHADRYKKRGCPFLSPTAFEPRGVKAKEPDIDGISVYRLDCLHSPEEVLKGLEGDKLAANGVVKVSYATLKQLGLTAVPIPSDIPGHCVIPELRVETLLENREDVEEKMGQLAEAASTNEAVVIRPPCLPAPD